MRTFLRPRLPADAGAPRLLHLHALPRPEPLPLYDTGANDFNFATIYTENAYGGNDRMADNNLLTLGVTTRLLDPTPAPRPCALGIAQRLRFSDQNVTLPGHARR
jgi:LPS-assembly protein